MSATYGTVCGALSRASQYYALDDKGQLKRKGRYQVLYGVRRALGALGISPLKCEINAMGACFERTRQHLGAHSLPFSMQTRRLYQQITHPDQLAIRIGYQVVQEAFHASAEIIHYIATHIDQWANLYPSLRNLQNARMIARLNGDLLAYVLPNEALIRRDREVIAAALKKDIGYWRCVDPIDRDDIEFIEFALKINGRLLEMLPRLQNSIPLILIALNQTPIAWKSVSQELKQYPGQLYYQIIQYAGEHSGIFANLPMDVLISPLFKQMILSSEHWVLFGKITFLSHPYLWQYYEPDMGSSSHEYARECYRANPQLYPLFSNKIQADLVILRSFLSISASYWEKIPSISELLKWMTAEQLLEIFNDRISADRSVFTHMKDEQLDFYYAHQVHAWVMIPLYWKNASLAKKILRLNCQALFVIQSDAPELFSLHKMEFYLAALSSQHYLWNRLESDLIEDPLFQIEALAINGKIMQWLPGSTSSFAEALKALESKSDCWDLVDCSLKINPRFIQAALQVNPWVASRLSIEDALIVCRNFPTCYRMLCEKLQMQTQLYSLIVLLDPSIIMILELPLLLKIFKKDSLLFEALPSSVHFHRKYKLAEVLIEPSKIKSIDSLNVEEVLALIEANPQVFRYIPQQFHDDSRIRELAITKDSYNFMELAFNHVNDARLWDILVKQEPYAFALISARMAHFSCCHELWYLPFFERYPEMLIDWVLGFGVHYESKKKKFFITTLTQPKPALGRWVLIHSKNEETVLPLEPRLQNCLLMMILRRRDLLKKVPIRFFENARFLESLLTLMPDLASYFVKLIPKAIKPLLTMLPEIRKCYFDGLNEMEVFNYLKLYPQDYRYLRGPLKENIMIASHVIDADPAYYLEFVDCVKSDLSIIKKVASINKLGFVLVCHHARKIGMLHELISQLLAVNPKRVIDLIQGWTLYRLSHNTNLQIQSFAERIHGAVLIDTQPPMIPSVDSVEVLDQYVKWIGIALTADATIYGDIPDFFRHHRDFVQRWLHLNPRLIRMVYKHRPRLAIQLATTCSTLNTYLYGQIVVGGRLYLPIKLKDEFRLHVVPLPDTDRLESIFTSIDQMTASMISKLQAMTHDQKLRAAEDKASFLFTEFTAETEALGTAIRSSFLSRLYNKISAMIEGWERDWRRLVGGEQRRFLRMIHTELQIPSHLPADLPQSDLDELFADAIIEIKTHLLRGFHTRLFNPSPGVGTPDPIKNPDEYGAFWKQIFLHLAHTNRVWEESKEPTIGVQLLYTQRYCPSNLQSQIHQLFTQFAVQSPLDPGLAIVAEIFSQKAHEAMEKVLFSCFPSSRVVRDPHHVNAVWHRYQEFTNQPLVVGDCHQEHYAQLFHEKMMDECFYISYDLHGISHEVARLYEISEVLRRFLDRYYAEYVADAWTAEDLASCQIEIDAAVIELWEIKVARTKELIQLAGMTSLTSQQKLKFMALGGNAAFDALDTSLRQSTNMELIDATLQEQKSTWVSLNYPRIRSEVIESKKALKKLIPTTGSGEICGSAIFKILEQLGFLHSERY